MRDTWVKGAIALLVIWSLANTAGLIAILSQTPPQTVTTTLTASTTLTMTTTTTTTANQAEIDMLKSQISRLNSSFASLLTMVNLQSSEIDVLQIPIIVRDNLGPTDILASYLVNPVISYVKNRTGIDTSIASGTIKTIVQSKLTRPDVELVSANRIQGHLYNVNVRVVIPFSLSEVPVAATAVNIVGDFTFYPYLKFTAQVNASNSVVSNLQYTGYGVE